VAVRINVLGPLLVDTGAQVLGPRDFGGAKPKQLLEILVVWRGQPVPKDRIADLLWGDRLPRNVSATLETYVSVLRNRLDPGGAPADSVVVTEPGAYRLDTARADVDLDAFDALLADGRHDDALALVRGDTLADEPYADWAEPLRSSMRAERVGALVAAGEQALGRGQLMQALARSDAAVALDPLSERAYRLGMAASYGLGRQEDALRAFDRCAKALIDELGVSPMAETEALAAAINRHADPAGLLPSGGPPPRTRIGRSHELETVLDGASRPGLVIIEGEAGIGKTRLLDDVAHALASSGRPFVRVRCLELERGLPLVPVRDALERLDTIVPSDEPVTLMRGLAAAARGAVLLVDDLQWADRDSITAFGFAARRGVSVVAAHRIGEVELDHPIRLLAPDVPVRLEAFTRAELDAAGAGHLFERTGGLPLFVGRWLEAPPAEGDGLPPSVREAAVSRCHLAGPFGFQVLLSASAFSGAFTPEATAAVMGVDAVRVAAELERLVVMRLLRPVAGGALFEFRYSIVREALAASLTPARRQVLARARAAWG
jgi:DNA-binding SARP family transcriptional activator